MSIMPGRVPISMPATPGLRQFVHCRQSPCISDALYPLTLNIGRRRYGTQKKAATDSHSFACTWLTTTPGEILPDDVLSSLPPVPSSTISEGNIPILLVTPHFAPWVDTANSILGQWVNRLYQNSHLPGPLYAIAAVVDKLPDARAQPEDVAETNHIVDAPESEGLSLLFVKPENVRGKPAPPRRIRSPEVEEPALVFSVHAGAPHTAGDTARKSIHEVGLRLANTIFVNGNENTMFGMSWTRDSASSSFVLDHSLSLSTCIIASAAKTVHNSFDLPLHPVSQRRRVVSSMGNILRQITRSTDDSSDEAMPASSELEKELPRYISEHDIADPLISVWALIEKPDVEPSIGDVQDRITKSLRAGGKLYRVMSGGGGWGKKQGLLSLDPDISLAEAATKEDLTVLNNLFGHNTEPVQDLPPVFDKRLLIDDLSLLSQTASTGDYVQFFASVEPDRSQNVRSDEQRTGLLYHFGVVFDAEDYGGEPTDSTSIPQRDLVILPNYFGALSTKTITYSQPIIKADSNGEELESCTKLDVPGSRVGLDLV